jgi:hypothetical protein
VGGYARGSWCLLAGPAQLWLGLLNTVLHTCMHFLEQPISQSANTGVMIFWFCVDATRDSIHHHLCLACMWGSHVVFFWWINLGLIPPCYCATSCCTTQCVVRLNLFFLLQALHCFHHSISWGLLLPRDAGGCSHVTVQTHISRVHPNNHDLSAL